MILFVWSKQSYLCNLLVTTFDTGEVDLNARMQSQLIIVASPHDRFGVLWSTVGRRSSWCDDAKASYSWTGHPLTDSQFLQDLTYRVRNNNNRKENLALLLKVSGYFRPGELAALVCRISVAHADGLMLLQVQILKVEVLELQHQ